MFALIYISFAIILPKVLIPFYEKNIYLYLQTPLDIISDDSIATEIDSSVAYIYEKDDVITVSSNLGEIIDLKANQILENIGGLFGVKNIPLVSTESIYYFKSYLIVIILAIIGATPIFKKIATSTKLEKIINLIEPIYLICILIICTSYIIDGSFNPFLYFRF